MPLLLFGQFGNLAISGRPMALRPDLAIGLPFSLPTGRRERFKSMSMKYTHHNPKPTTPTARVKFCGWFIVENSALSLESLGFRPVLSRSCRCDELG